MSTVARPPTRAKHSGGLQASMVELITTRYRNDIDATLKKARMSESERRLFMEAVADASESLRWCDNHRDLILKVKAELESSPA